MKKTLRDIVVTLSLTLFKLLYVRYLHLFFQVTS